jgi:hypothetical protein
MKVFEFNLKNLTLFLASFMLISCNRDPEVINEFPYDIYKRLAISEKCDLIAFSSNNRDNFFPQFILGSFNNSPKLVTPHFTNSTDIFPQSISCDCKLASMIQKKGNDDGFNLLIYNIKGQDRRLIAEGIDADGGSSMFSPERTFLAYLDNHKLNLYDPLRRLHILVNNPRDVDFKNLTWSNKGKYVFLEDYAGDIWQYFVSDKSFKLIWQSEEQTYTVDRLISPSADNEEELYFISDHNSQFNQIYKLSPGKGVFKFVNSEFDKFLLKRPISERNFYFRTNHNGYYYLQRKVGDRIVDISRHEQVVYDYFQGADSTKIILSSTSLSPVSIFYEKGVLKPITKNVATSEGIIPTIVYNKEGIHNLVYKPSGELRGWLMWIHGGPFEQVSIRYNSYISALNKLGWGIVVINYPGSTGIGNQYELRGSAGYINVQTSTIHRDIESIKQKFQINKYSMMGISYGSIIVSNYAHLFKNELLAIIEFSGTNNTKYPSSIQRLLIYGLDDYVLKDRRRKDMIAEELRSGGAKFLKLTNEGHVISSRSNQIKIINTISAFLNND